MRKAFIYDFDGTLTDSFGIIVQIIRDNKAYFKTDLDKLNVTNKLRDIPADGILQYLNIPKDKMPEYLHFMNSQMRLYIKDLKLIKGIDLALSHIAQEGIFQGIVSSNSRENITAFLRNKKIRSYFSEIITSSTLFDKDLCLSKIIRTYKIPKEDIWFIGDEPRDIIAGQKVGVRTIGVTWGLSSRKLLLKYAPTAIVDDPSELLGFTV